MSPAEAVRIAFAALRRRPLRAALTAACAAVAVATVFGTRGLLRGSEAGLEADLGRLGLRTVQVMAVPHLAPAGLPAPPRPLDDADLAAARRALEEAGVAAEVVGARVTLGVAAVPALGKAAAVPLVCAPPSYFRTFDAAFAAGGPPGPGGATLDANLAASLDEALAPGASLEVRGAAGARTVRLDGVVADPFRLRPKDHAPDMTAGARRAAAQILAFRNAYLPEDAPEAAGAPLVILAILERRGDASRAHGALERALDSRGRGLMVWSRGTWARTVLEQAGEMSELVNIVWIVVLAVALVMIATVTLVATRERVPELALRRAEGATRAQVAAQLLLEGGATALAGGVAGIPVGAAVAAILARLLTFGPVHDAAEAALAVALGTATGTAAAAIPAWRAARAEIVEGLRGGR